ncbi:hypothetical protein [Phormidium sp. CCY1219]|nr:hypothetical protein [Phormidium sp. CCY1219]
MPLNLGLQQAAAFTTLEVGDGQIWPRHLGDRANLTRDAIAL